MSTNKNRGGMIRLGVNVDHVATVRNARGESYPSPVQAAALCELGGADNITCHLREDRRHIRDSDLEMLKASINIPLNFEMAATTEMLNKALSIKPHAVTLVPERRAERTTEGGLDVKANANTLLKMIERMSDAGILVSLFIAPSEADIVLSQKIGAKAVEFHTGDFCHSMQKASRTKEQYELLKPLIRSAMLANDQGLQVHFGHGLNYQNAHWLQLVPYCEEANIGHAIISQAIFIGLQSAVSTMKERLNHPSFCPMEWPL